MFKKSDPSPAEDNQLPPPTSLLAPGKGRSASFTALYPVQDSPVAVWPLPPFHNQLLSLLCPGLSLQIIKQPSISAPLAFCLHLTRARRVLFRTSVLALPSGWNLKPSVRLVPSQRSGLCSHSSSEASPGAPPTPVPLCAAAGF